MEGINIPCENDLIVKNCAVCGNQDWRQFLQTDTNRILAGDLRIIEGNLRKNICKVCGTVTNVKSFSDEELSIFYGDEYELNTQEKQQHHYLTSSGAFSRSEVFAQWIAPHLPESFDVLLEVGCGQGNLLENLQSYFPEKKFMGIDGSERAVKIAKSKGLNVYQGLILGHEESLPRSDVILAVNVIEHVEDISGFLSTLISACNSNGRIILCLPIQNYPGYDVFFYEHIWHFTVSQFCYILARNNLNVIHIDYNHPIIHGIGLFVCEISEQYKDLLLSPLSHESRYIISNRDYWLDVFNRINNWLKNFPEDDIAVYGSGEVLALFMAYTDLWNKSIKVCFDDDINKVGTKSFGIPVHSIEWLNSKHVDTVLLTLNQKYHPQVLKKLKPYGVQVFSWA